MFLNYLKVAFRNLTRHKLFTLINLSGLSMGMTVSMVILLYVAHEFSYDKFRPNADRIFRVLSASEFGGQQMTQTNFHESFAGILKTHIPEVGSTVRYQKIYGEKLLSTGSDRTFKESGLFSADQSLFSVFSIELSSGDEQNALTAPRSIVLTRQLAVKYFGEEDPLGKTLVYDGKYPLTVTGITPDPPSNTTLDYKALISVSSLPTFEETKEMFEVAGIFDTYLLLDRKEDRNGVEAKIAGAAKNLNFRDEKAKYSLEALPDLHLYSKSGNNSALKYLFIFAVAAISILALALINYASLTTARSTQRSKEVGIRKAIGGKRRQLGVQFFTETLLTTAVAFGISLLLLRQVLTLFYSLMDIRMDDTFIRSPVFIALLTGMFLFSSFLAGFWPGLVLSGFSPLQVLRGHFSKGRSGANTRRVLTVFQFAVSIGLICCTLLIVEQLDFMRNKDLGMQKNQVLAIALEPQPAGSPALLKEKIRALPGVKRLTSSTTPFLKEKSGGMGMLFARFPDSGKQLGIRFADVDEQFFNTLEIPWSIAPLNWDNRAAKFPLYIINETLLKQMDIPQEDPVGEKLPFGEATIGGVVKDFNFSSLHYGIDPLMITVSSDTSRSLIGQGGYLFARLDSPKSYPELLSRIGDIVKGYQPEAPFDYYFMDEAFDKLYKTEQKMGRLFGIFSGIAILIACLGLVGLIAYTVERRTKEIGIRKILGATITGLVGLLSGEFLILVLVSLLVAAPLSWYFMGKWLEDFAYRIEIGWQVFALGGIFAMAIAFITVSFQSFKAAKADPARSLRSE